MPLRVLLVTDALLPPARGNGTTVARWIEGLERRGVHVEVVEPDCEPRRAHDFDLVHGYHAERCGPWCVELAARFGIPSIVSLGGTDLWSLEDGSDRLGRGALARCDLVTGAFASFGPRAARAVGVPRPYAVVRRGVFRDPDPWLERGRDRLEIALPAGLRRVKDPLFAISRFATLVRAGIAARLRIVGSVFEDEYAARVRDAARDLPGVEIGARPPVAMGAVYARAHVVWNTSLHEGGANAVLEAAALGCVPYLRDVPGNRDLAAEPDSPVALFARDDAGLIAFHRGLLVESAAARTARQDATAAWLVRCHDPGDEIDDLLRAYATVIESKPAGPRSP